MLLAVYFLYRAAQELFGREIGLITAVVFSLHPIVIFAAIDVRPYAFGALATNAAIFILVRMRHNNSKRLAVFLGFSAACIVWFHYLFIVILPALVVCFFAVKIRRHKGVWKQFGIALVAFHIAFAPVIPGFISLFRNSKSHVFESAPTAQEFIWTLAPSLLMIIFGSVALIAIVLPTFSKKGNRVPFSFEGWQLLVCASLAFIPILVLFGVSATTPLHVFTYRHRLIAVPGISLCWAYAVSFFRPSFLRILFCTVLVVSMTLIYFSNPLGRCHLYSWKNALAVVQESASMDNSPVIICSDFVEADYASMSPVNAKDSFYFTQLSYYKLTVPVIPMPRSLNDEAIRIGSRFVQEATLKHMRFFAVALTPSYRTVDWITDSTVKSYSMRRLGIYDGVEVVEYDPHRDAGCRQKGIR